MLGARGFSRGATLAVALTIAGAVGFLALAGCSTTDNPTKPPGGTGSTTSFTGVFTSGTQSGKLTASVGAVSLAPRFGGNLAAMGVVTATGTAVLGSTTINLTGTYDTSAHTLLIGGGGYSFQGGYDATAHGKPSISGQWGGPGGVSDTGEFTCYLGNSSSVNVYCGEYHSTTTPADSGRFSFDVNDTLVTGYTHMDGAPTFGGIFFEGRVPATGNPRAITINYAPGGYTLVAPGTLDTLGLDAVSGTYTFTDSLGSDAGNWSGTLCQ